MKFKIDENLPSEAAEVLREAGFDAETVWDEGLAGSSDAELSFPTKTGGRTLITADLDFASIMAYPPEQFPGTLVLRRKNHAKSNVVATFKRLVLALDHRDPNNELWIVEEKGIRFRRAEST